jgi:hypothetical protein
MLSALLVSAGPAGRALAAAVPQAPIPPQPVPPVTGPPVSPQPDGLLVTVRDSASSPPFSWSLSCNPVGGSHPNPVAACDTLSRTSNPFAPAPAGVMCSLIYYGPQTATITGYWQGQPVSAQFSRTDGCQEQRWEKIAAVLVIPVFPGPVNPGGPFHPYPLTPARPAAAGSGG